MKKLVDEDALAEAYNQALELEAAGQIDEAVEAFEKVLAMDPADPGGVSVRLAALKRGPVPQKASDAYVEMLFDQHADLFESILVDQLQYGVPELTRQRLDALELGPFQRLLDLGCGTGLVAEAMEGRVKEAIGIDLSERMIDICEEKDIYDGLYVGEVVDFLDENEEELFDLITACDVLPYLGALEPLIGGIAANLAEDGVIVFSSETLDEEAFAEQGYVVGVEKRFAHSQAYIRQVLDSHRFRVLSLEPINVRLTDGEPTPGHLVVAQR